MELSMIACTEKDLLTTIKKKGAQKHIPDEELVHGLFA